MPSRRHELLARVVPRVRKARELVDEPTERARLERWHASLDRSLPTRAVPRFDRRFVVVKEELAAGFPAYVITPRRVTPTRTLFYLHGGGYVGADRSLPGPLRHPPGRRDRRPRRAARLSARTRALLARQPRHRRRPRRPLGSGAGRHRPCGRLFRRWLRLGPRADPPRQRPSAAHPPASPLAVGRPDNQHAGDAGLRRRRPVAPHRQAPRVRRLVGRLPRGPRPPRGQPRAGRPGSPAAGADVLRHPRPAGAGVPAAAPPRRRGRLEPDRRRAARADPRLPTAARSCPRHARRSARRWSSWAPKDDGLGARLRRAGPAHGLRRVAPAAAGVRRGTGLALPRPRWPRPRTGHQAPAAS